MTTAPHLDDTDPALPALRMEAFPSVSPALLVLTGDLQLVEILRNASAGHEVIAVATELELATQLAQDRSGVALIDSAGLTSPVTHLTERLKAQFPELVLVVAGDTGDQGALTPQITRGTVYRFLHKPLSEQRVRLSVAAAWRRRSEEHTDVPAPTQTQTTRTLPVARSRKGPWIAIVAGLVLLGSGAWFMLRERHASAPAPAPARMPASVQTGTAAPMVAAEIQTSESIEGNTEQKRPPAEKPTAEPSPGSAAATATSNGTLRTTEPTAAPAPQLARPRTAMPVEASADASGMSPGRKPSTSPDLASSPIETAPSALAVRIASEARNALDEGKVDEAERLIQIAAEAGVGEEDLDDLVRKARELRIAARGRAMTRLTERFNERMTQGKLLDPADDSAKHYLAELVATDVEHPSTRMARESFATRLLREARKSAVDDPAAAQRWLVEARAVGANESAMEGVEKDIAAAQEAATKANELVNATSLNKLRHVDPEYPSLASSRNLSGWVDLEITVKTDGSVGDIVVTHTEPAGVFDKAAIDAVRQWRYEPVQRDGKIVEQRARMRIRFQLK